MKYILFILLSFVFLNLKAQLPTGVPTQKINGWAEANYYVPDSGAVAPKRDTLWVPRFPGTMVTWYHAGVDTAVWFWNSSTWNKLANAGNVITQNIANASLKANGTYLQNWNHDQLLFDTVNWFQVKGFENDATFSTRKTKYTLKMFPDFSALPLDFSIQLRNVANNADSLNNGFFVSGNITTLSAIAAPASGTLFAQAKANANSGAPNVDIRAANAATRTSFITVFADSIDVSGAVAAATADSIFAFSKFKSATGSNKLLKIPIPVTGGAGTLTSVGLTMPTAFTVTSTTANPITTNGTFNVTANGTSAQYIKGNGVLGTTDTSMIPSFFTKVRSLFSGASPITYNSFTGTFGINNANTSGTKGAASFNNSDFVSDGSGGISLSDLSGGSCINCNLTITKGRISVFANGSSAVDTISNVLKSNDSVFVNSATQSNYRFRDSVRWGVVRDTIAKVIPANIRNDANSVIRLTTGRLICAYTAFGAISGDADSAIIVTRVSDDNGVTWSNLDTAVNVSANGNYIPSLYFNPAGDTLRMVYLRANSLTTDQIYSTYCVNFNSNSMVWSTPALAFGSGSQYYSPASDRVFRSKAGVYFYPLPVHIDGELASGAGRYDGYLLRSYNGVNWDTVPGVRLISPDTLFVEGGLIQTDDTYSFITYYARTRGGQVYMSQSTDSSASSFGAVYPWGLYAPNSTTTVKYLEQYKTLVAIHNRFIGSGFVNSSVGRRVMDMSVRKIAPPNVNLNIAPDAFSGQWEFLYRIDSLTGKQFIEPSIAFSDNEILVTYSYGDYPNGDSFGLKTKKLPYYFLINTSNRDAQQLVLNKTFNGTDANFIEMFSNGLDPATTFFKLRNQTSGNTSFGGWIDVQGHGVGANSPLYITPRGNCVSGGVWIDPDNGSGSAITNSAIVFRLTNSGGEREKVLGDGSVINYNASGEINHLFANTGNLIVGASGLDNGIGKIQVGGKITVAAHAVASNSDSALIWDRSTLEYKVARINSGISTLNTLTAATQTFATGASGSDFNISSSTSTHTFNIPSASTSNRGLVTVSSQTFGGNKTFNDGIIVTSSANTPRISVTGNFATASEPGIAGVELGMDNFTYTDNGASRTVSQGQNISLIGQPTITSGNAITYSGDASTVRFVGAPVAAGSMTISHPWNIFANNNNYISGIAFGLNEQNTSASLGDAAFNVFAGTTATYTLPALSTWPGKIYYIKNAGSGNLTVSRAGSDNLYTTTSVTTITVAAGASVVILAGSAFWYVM